ncbi:peptidylprolyl isomerase [Trichothermofontia sp.]
MGIFVLLNQFSRRWHPWRWLGVGFLLLSLMLSACASPQAETAPAPETPAAEATTTPVSSPSPPSPTPTAAPSNTFANLPRLNGEAIVELTVKGEPITIAVDGVNAPITAGNFVDLVQRGVYDGTAFHRVVREPTPFVVQGGDPLSKNPAFQAQVGAGGFVDPAAPCDPQSLPPGVPPEVGCARNIPLEIKPAGAQVPLYSKTFQQAGILDPPQLPHRRGAVAMARSQLPDSASAQFYITLADQQFLDGSYAVFGYVTEGMDVVDQIQQGDRIDAARVVAGADKLQPVR